jgi:hypothetical protein
LTQKHGEISSGTEIKKSEEELMLYFIGLDTKLGQANALRS